MTYVMLKTRAPPGAMVAHTFLGREEWDWMLKDRPSLQDQWVESGEVQTKEEAHALCKLMPSRESDS